MKNILLIADYLKLDQWGMLAYSYLNALRQDETINLVARTIDFGVPKREKPDWLHILESKTEEKYHVVLQCCPPQFYNFGPGYHGIFIMEPSYLSNKSWVRKLNKLPLIVSSNEERLYLSSSEVYSEITVVPPYIDLSFLYNIYDFPQISNLKNNYIFYWVGEYGERSNYKDVCRAFNATFTNRDKVKLVLCFLENYSESLLERIMDEIKSLKLSTGMQKNAQNYPNEAILITPSLEEVRKLHAHSNCLVDVSHGGCFSQIVLEAMAFGNQVLLNKSYKDYGVGQPTYVYSESKEIFGSENYNCMSMWKYVCFSELCRQMMECFLLNEKKSYKLDGYSLKSTLKEFERVLG